MIFGRTSVLEATSVALFHALVVRSCSGGEARSPDLTIMSRAL